MIVRASILGVCVCVWRWVGGWRRMCYCHALLRLQSDLARAEVVLMAPAPLSCQASNGAVNAASVPYCSSSSSSAAPRRAGGCAAVRHACALPAGACYRPCHHKCRLAAVAPTRAGPSPIWHLPFRASLATASVVPPARPAAHLQAGGPPSGRGEAEGGDEEDVVGVDEAEGAPPTKAAKTCEADQQ